MSLRALQWAFSLSLPPTPKYVLVALADHADEAGIYWPSSTHLAEKTGLSARTVRAALSSLKACALVVSQKRRGRTPQLGLALGTVGTTPAMLAQLRGGAKTGAPPPASIRLIAPPPAPKITASHAASAYARAARQRQLVPPERHELPPYRTNQNRHDSCSPLPQPPQRRTCLTPSSRDQNGASSKGLSDLPSFIPSEAWIGYLDQQA